MRIKAMHNNFKLPTRSTDLSGGYDIYLPENVVIKYDEPTEIALGFAMEVPENHVAILAPRSSAGSKLGIKLTNTMGVIDADYRGEWIAKVILDLDKDEIFCKAGERILQFIVVPVLTSTLELVDELSSTDRDAGGYGSTGV